MTGGSAPPPHDFADHKQHMQWQMERHKYSNVPAIPADLSAGSKNTNHSGELLQKAFQNPLVPIGMIATTGCLVGMLVSSLRRNQMNAQYFMRGRCAAQFFTVCALVGGAIIAGKAAESSKTVPAPS